jgi:LmbE family N-acetylglucosaminyl deacetylase
LVADGRLGTIGGHNQTGGRPAPPAGQAERRTGIPTNELETPRIAAAIMAHPDDPEFSAAGTLARWTAQGAQVHLVVVTDGSKGSPDRAALGHELIATRQAEQRAAGGVLGVASVTFLGEVDGELEPSLRLRRLITREIRRLATT